MTIEDIFRRYMTVLCPIRNAVYVQGAQNVMDGCMLFLMSDHQQKMYKNWYGRGDMGYDCISNVMSIRIVQV